MLTAVDYYAVMNWLKDPNRKPATLAFTDGVARQAAYAVEGSGILTRLLALEAQLAAVGKVEEMLGKGVEILIRPAKDFGGGYIAEVRDGKLHHDLYAKYGDTILKLFAALVNDANGKENA